MDIVGPSCRIRQAINVEFIRKDELIARRRTMRDRLRFGDSQSRC
jgi:hypothetical protein